MIICDRCQKIIRETLRTRIGEQDRDLCAPCYQEWGAIDKRLSEEWCVKRREVEEEAFVEWLKSPLPEA